MAKSGGDTERLVKEKLADIGIIIAVIFIGLLQFGWVFWPKLGFILGGINAVIILGIIIVGIAFRIFKREKHSE